MTATLNRRATARVRSEVSTEATAPPPADPVATLAAAPAAERLRRQFAAVRVAFTWFGVRKALSAEQKAQTAEQFGADGGFLSAAKKLLDTKHEAFGRVTALRTQIVAYWKGLTLPYPDPGVRLIRQDDVAGFDARMTGFRAELDASVENLDAHYAQLRTAAADRLGRLYDEADYPPTLRGLFGVEFDFPSVEPPEYLLRLNPHLYDQERQRVAARFDEAARLAEEAFAAEFARLVSHLTQRLAPGPGGERKVFRDSAVENLRAFFGRFRHLSVRGDADLDRLVESAQRAVAGVDAQAVRDSDALRQHVRAELASVQASLDGLLIDQPRRRVLRLGRPAGAGEGVRG